MSLDRLEGLARAVAKVIGGDPEQWRQIVGLLRDPLAAALPFFTPATASELEALFALDVGQGPVDPDPGDW